MMRSSCLFLLLISILYFDLVNSDNYRNESKKNIKNNTMASVLSILSNLWKFINEIIEQPMNLRAFVSKLVQIGDRLTQILYPPPELPHIPQDTWWGDDHSYRHHDTSIRPYMIKFNEENFTESLEGSAMTYGINANFINSLLDYWETGYDFEKREDNLNTYPQFMTNIQGLDIHFVHIKPEAQDKKIIPILLLHGWPLTNMEYFNVFPLLTHPRHDYEFVFEVIAPSIPGFGYSEGTQRIGLSPYQVGVIFKNLMSRLGFVKFYIHGGDFGEFIGSSMATIYPDDILGFHTNMPYSVIPKTLVKYLIGDLDPPVVAPIKYIDRLYPISARLYYYITNFGYFHMHATQPDTIGKSLEDSPSGLASWILSPVTFATNPNYIYRDDGNLVQTFGIDNILDVFTITWDAKCITTSSRLYAETTAVFQDSTTLKILRTPTKVPFAAIKFRHEIIYQPDDFLRDKYPNLVHSTTVDFGGHFAAAENTEILSNDIWESVNKMIDFH